MKSDNAILQMCIRISVSRGPRGWHSKAEDASQVAEYSCLANYTSQVAGYS